MNDKADYNHDTGLEHLVDNKKHMRVMSISSLTNANTHHHDTDKIYRIILEDSEEAKIFNRISECAVYILGVYDDARLSIDHSFGEEESAVLKKSEHLQNLLVELHNRSPEDYFSALINVNYRLMDDNQDDFRKISACLDSATRDINLYLSP